MTSTVTTAVITRCSQVFDNRVLAFSDSASMMSLSRARAQMTTAATRRSTTVGCASMRTRSARFEPDFVVNPDSSVDVMTAHFPSRRVRCASCWMVSVTVVMSTVPTYSPREPVTTAFPPSARMASNASWSVDCVLTESPTGLPTVVSEDAAGRSRTCTQRFGLRRSSRTSAYVRRLLGQAFVQLGG